MKKIVNSPFAPDPVGPYNQAIRVDSLLFLSGQIALDKETGQLVQEDIIAETHQVMRNIGYVLKAEGMDYNNLVKCTIFVSDISDYGKINGVYAQYFNEATAPARELVEVTALPKGGNIEISAIAVKP